MSACYALYKVMLACRLLDRAQATVVKILQELLPTFSCCLWQCMMCYAVCCCRRGLKLDVADEETDNKYREPFFNFYDDRLMGLEWSKQPNPELTCQFFRLLALCHTVIPEGACAAAAVRLACWPCCSTSCRLMLAGLPVLQAAASRKLCTRAQLGCSNTAYRLCCHIDKPTVACYVRSYRAANP